jgi:hypothetical protein
MGSYEIIGIVLFIGRKKHLNDCSFAGNDARLKMKKTPEKNRTRAHEEKCNFKA